MAYCSASPRAHTHTEANHIKKSILSIVSKFMAIKTWRVGKYRELILNIFFISYDLLLYVLSVFDIHTRHSLFHALSHRVIFHVTFVTLEHVAYMIVFLAPPLDFSYPPSKKSLWHFSLPALCALSDKYLISFHLMLHACTAIPNRYTALFD